MSQTWKAVERQLAERLNGERVPVSGRTGEKGQETPDIVHDEFAIEVKHRKKGLLPRWLFAALHQAHASRKEHHRAAIVILHEAGKRHDNDLVLMSFKDFQALSAAPVNPCIQSD